jgi:hypothetical protein
MDAQAKKLAVLSLSRRMVLIMINGNTLKP